MGDVWESDGVVVETWESSTEPGVTFTTVIREGDIVTGGSGGDLSDAAPQDLGTAAAGVSDEASRADHVHDMPTATDVGADPSGTAATAVTVHTADTTAVHGIADTSALVVTSDARLSDARTPTAHTHPAADITVDASGFNGNLTTSDDTVQEIAQKVDDLVIPAAGIADPGGANDDFLQRKSGAWTYRTVAQVKTDLGVASSGRYLDGIYCLLSRRMGDLPGDSTNYAPGANVLVAQMVEVVEPVAVSGRWMYVQTASPGVVFRPGLYASSTSTGLPTGAPLVTTPGVNAATNGYKVDTFTQTGTIQPGFYWEVTASSGAAAGYRGHVSASTSIAIDMGHASGGSYANKSFTASWTFNSGALPDVTALTWSASITLPGPYIRWRTERV